MRSEKVKNWVTRLSIEKKLLERAYIGYVPK